MSAAIFKATFWVALALLVYVYAGYEWLLRAASALRRAPTTTGGGAAQPGFAPRITVLITAHNEASRIAQRVANVLACSYPDDRLEVLVASDGSDDGTDDIVRRLANAHPVRLFASGGRLGKTETQNRALGEARGEIIVFTDAETHFATDFLAEIARPFQDPAVGMTTAVIELTDASGAVAHSQGLYWSYEMRVRRRESSLGILAVASGQAMAARKSLLRPMDASIGEDCIVPLDVVIQGARAIHCERALARDAFESDPAKEFRTRVRMTLRNWQGTWSRPSLLNPLRHPGYAFALWSHKVLRWLSPFYVLVATLSVAVLAADPPYRWFAVLAVLGYLGVVLGWLGDRYRFRVPLAVQLYSFALANVGFAVGVVRALRGHQIRAYRSGALEDGAARRSEGHDG